jgi:type III secretory pathway component EscT
MKTQTEVRKQYYREFWLSMFAYLIVTFAVGLFVKHGKPTGLLLYILAPLPSIPIAFNFLALLRYLKNCDEYIRNAITRVLVMAVGVTLFFTTFWGFLETFADAPHLMSNLVYAVFWFSYFVIYAIGKFVFKSLDTDGAAI